MRKKVLSVLLAFVGSVSLGVPAIAFEKCPVDDAQTEKSGSYVEAVVAAVRNAPSCDQAFRTLEGCLLGSTADNPLSDEVMSKCEADFMDKIDAAKKQAYKKALDRCNKIAEKNAGTMYQSFAAVCQAGVSRDFARKYSGRANGNVPRAQQGTPVLRSAR
jgi:hypothetical protein